MSFGSINRINIFNKKKSIQGNYIYDPSFANQILTRTGEGNLSNLNISNDGEKLTATTQLSTTGKLHFSTNNGVSVTENYKESPVDVTYHCAASDFSAMYFSSNNLRFSRMSPPEYLNNKNRSSPLTAMNKIVCSKNGCAVMFSCPFSSAGSSVLRIEFYIAGQTDHQWSTSFPEAYYGSLTQNLGTPAMAVSAESYTNHIAMSIYKSTTPYIYIGTSSTVTGATPNAWYLYQFNKKDVNQVALTNISNNVVTAFIACGGTTNPGLWKMTFNRTDNQTTRTTNLNNPSYFTNITPDASDNIIQAVAISTDGNYIVASSTTKIYCSRDGGLVWNVCANYPAINIALSEKGHHAMIATNSTGNTNLYNFLRLSRPIT